jgi:hypothetical protein
MAPYIGFSGQGRTLQKNLHSHGDLAYLARFTQ